MWLIWSTCSDPLLMGLNYIWWVLDKFCRITSLCPIIKLLGVVVVSWIIHKASHLLIFRYLFSSFVFFGFFLYLLGKLTSRFFLQGRSAYQDHFGFLQSTLSGNNLQNNQLSANLFIYFQFSFTNTMQCFLVFFRLKESVS